MSWRDLLPDRVRDVLRNLRHGGAVKAKRARELAYWNGRAEDERVLTNAHYEEYFTVPFDLSASWFSNRSIIDIGCGPRGSLEWAARASLRVGVDPLVDAYRRFGITDHQMRYVAARAEELPFPDASFDVVSTLNSLDHVEDVGLAAQEMSRVLAPGGSLLLVVEVNHPPTVEEPHQLSWDVVDLFAPGLVPASVRHKEVENRQFSTSAAHGADVDPSSHDGPALLVARLSRRS